MGFKISRSYLDTAPAAPAPTPSRGAGLAKTAGGGSKKAKLISAGVVAGTAGLAGYVEGKGMLPGIPGAPVWLGTDLLIGAALHAATFFFGNKLGRAAPYMADAGTGLISYWAGVQGFSLGQTGKFTATTKGESYPVMPQQAGVPVGAQVFQSQF